MHGLRVDEHARNPSDADAVLSRYGRLLYLSVAAAALAVLWLSSWLEPSPAGFGTHRRLGLPPCLFRACTRLPCPSCGLTTSFAHAARFQLRRAAAVHPFGPLAFALTWLAIPLSGVLLWRRVSWPSLLAARLWKPLLWTLGAIYTAAWVHNLLLALTAARR